MDDFDRVAYVPDGFQMPRDREHFTSMRLANVSGPDARSEHASVGDEDLYRYAAVDGPGVAIRLVGTMGMVALLLAIGAGQADVLRLVMGKGLVLMGVGTVIGLMMGFVVEQLMNSMLFNAGGIDLVAYAVVVLSMFLVITLAAYVPARRASRISPTQALRYE